MSRSYAWRSSQSSAQLTICVEQRKTVKQSRAASHRTKKAGLPTVLGWAKFSKSPMSVQKRTWSLHYITAKPAVARCTDWPCGLLVADGITPGAILLGCPSVACISQLGSALSVAQKVRWLAAKVHWTWRPPRAWPLDCPLRSKQQAPTSTRCPPKTTPQSDDSIIVRPWSVKHTAPPPLIAHLFWRYFFSAPLVTKTIYLSRAASPLPRLVNIFCVTPN